MHYRVAACGRGWRESTARIFAGKHALAVRLASNAGWRVCRDGCRIPGWPGPHVVRQTPSGLGVYTVDGAVDSISTMNSLFYDSSWDPDMIASFM